MLPKCVRLAFGLLCVLGSCLALPWSASAAEPVTDTILTGFTQQSSPGRFVAILELVGTPRSRILLLRNPDRIAVDLFDTVAALPAPSLEANPLVSELRQGLVSSDRFRLIFTLKRAALPKASMEARGGRTMLTLAMDASSAEGFDAAAASQSIASPAKAAGPGPAGSGASGPGQGGQKFVVVIDPGHGGVDTGAVGRHGTLEKEINLGFALALRDILEKDDRIDVLMTRSDDTFITLGERSEIARRAKASLFISMHADSIRFPSLRGATVYTLSGRASDSLSREVAESENAADRFADASLKQGEPEVFDILVELMRRETDSFSQHFAAGLVEELGRHDIRLIRNPKRSAGFKVLTAPDVPSVLLEIGYLSNVDDEQLLLDRSWREDTAAAIAAAVIGFLEPDGSQPTAGVK